MEGTKEGKKERLSIYDTWWKHLLAGSSAGVVSRSCTAPLDRLKVFAQVTGKFYHPIKGLVSIVKKDGFFSLWRGNGINMMKITPETACKFLVFEYVKLLMGAQHRSLTIGERFFCAACAGVTSQSLIYPIEVLKTRMVIREGRDKVHSLKNVYKTLIKNRGHEGLYKGYFSTIVGIVLFTGTDLCTYETTKIFLSERLKIDPKNVPLPIILLSGIFACITGQAVAYPLSMASTAVQASEKKIEARHVLYDRFKRLGIYGWYRGSSMSYLKALPAVSLTYMVYERTLNALGAHMTH
ncbi:calcium-binding mitochondrial carrier protein SCaMC-2-A [Halyomorpha halys]|uniref:calcium-binding mitochondrial carrier protein SCaMC-2-A n=1 Tax=Halyomorpha halys TaxID=286706 RepID=UPI0006D4FBF8|nr:calcium-binding mitochondrial carrier protein SCaMC-2-A-like [Halyomorpha halys]